MRESEVPWWGFFPVFEASGKNADSLCVTTRLTAWRFHFILGNSLYDEKGITASE